jgi:hypothetical protein
MEQSERQTATVARAAENEASFRNANERLEDKRIELGLGGRTPFLCECGDRECTTLIPLSLEEYEHVRSHATWFVVAARHRAPEDVTVEPHGDYAIVQKAGLAARIAKEEDPRGGTSER